MRSTINCLALVKTRICGTILKTELLKMPLECFVLCISSFLIVVCRPSLVLFFITVLIFITLLKSINFKCCDFNRKVESFLCNFPRRQGWFRDTEMYYGAYSNATIEVISTMHYNIPFAYLCVAGGYILICLIILVRRYSAMIRITHCKLFRSTNDTRRMH